jgi:beta-lactamase superfamily II metal-dependent hydrolase
MFEVEFQSVGEGEKSGDAITVRFTNPASGEPVIGIIDAGFTDTGDAVVRHVQTFYGTSSVDFVLSTHPDADHINGMGIVMRNLNVANLLIHRPALHGYPQNSGSRPAEELTKLAEAQNVKVIEPFTGAGGYGGAFRIAGPTESYYEQMLAEQEVTEKAAVAKRSVAQRFLAEAATFAERVLSHFPMEIDFDDAGGTNPRNNSSAIVSFIFDGKHVLLPSDAGVPAINHALDYLDQQQRTFAPLELIALPHHGSRHNLDLDTIERLVGAAPAHSRAGTAITSVSKESSLPSPRVANAFGRRGYPVFPTGDSHTYIRHASPDAPPRHGLVLVNPLPPLVEDDQDD